MSVSPTTLLLLLFLPSGVHNNINQAPNPASAAQEQATWLHRTIDTTASAALAVFEFFARVTTTSERPLYFVLLEAAPRKGALPDICG
jgi:hypothetical protein